jgi:hypothetical protein
MHQAVVFGSRSRWVQQLMHTIASQMTGDIRGHVASVSPTVAGSAEGEAGGDSSATGLCGEAPPLLGPTPPALLAPGMPAETAVMMRCVRAPMRDPTSARSCDPLSITPCKGDDSDNLEL